MSVPCSAINFVRLSVAMFKLIIGLRGCIQTGVYQELSSKDMQFTYNVTLRRVRATINAVEKQ